MAVGFPDSAQVLAMRVPLCARRVLHVHCGDGFLGASLKGRDRSVEVFGMESENSGAPAARSVLDGVLPLSFSNVELPFPAGYFDCIVFSEPERLQNTQGLALAALAPLLSKDGYLLMPLEEREGAADRVSGLLNAAGLTLYMLWPWGAFSATLPPPKGYANPHGMWVCHALWPIYNPVIHARELFARQHADQAYEILCGIPPHYLTDPEVDAMVRAEKQLCLLAMDKPGGPFPPLQLFNAALILLYDIVEKLPTFHEGYQNQAEFWRRIGDDDMASRLLRSLQHAAPREDTAQQMTRFMRPSPVREETAPEWSGAWRPRVLMFMLPGRSHYGMDVLYDGLCSVLGDDQVVDYPWKATLHGHVPTRTEYYPCLFRRSGSPRQLEQLLSEVRAGQFGLIVVPFTEEEQEYAHIRALLQECGDTPVAAIDAGDDCVSNLSRMLRVLERDSVDAYFKREHLACADYGPAFPFPIAHPDHLVAEDITQARPHRVFWAGHRLLGLRRLYLERMERILGESFDAIYPQSEYVHRMRASQVGVSIFGAGFDCVRYWELPANGCLLFAERPPIRIPHNFRDGETAVFFTDLSDFEEKLVYYLDHSDTAAEIARAGHEHLKRYHTASARARQVLGYIEQAMRRSC